MKTEQDKDFIKFLYDKMISNNSNKITIKMINGTVSLNVFSEDKVLYEDIEDKYKKNILSSLLKVENLKNFLITKEFEKSELVFFYHNKDIFDYVEYNKRFNGNEFNPLVENIVPKLIKFNIYYASSEVENSLILKIKKEKSLCDM